MRLDAFNLREARKAYEEESLKADHVRIFSSDGCRVADLVFVFADGDDRRRLFEDVIAPLLRKGYRFEISNGAEVLSAFGPDGVYL